MVSAQPDSMGTVPSGATLSEGAGGAGWLPQLLQPVAGGRGCSLVPYTWKPFTCNGVSFDCWVAVMRTQRAVTGWASGICISPPAPDVVWYTVLHVVPSVDTSSWNAVGQLDMISQPVVLA